MGCEDFSAYWFYNDIEKFLKEGVFRKDPLVLKIYKAERILYRPDLALGLINEFIRDVLEKKCNDPKVLRKLSRAYLLGGLIYLENRAFNKAIEYYSEAIKILENLPEEFKEDCPEVLLYLSKAYSNRGNSYSQSGNIEEAIKDLIKALEISRRIKYLPKNSSDKRKELLINIYNELAIAYDSLGYKDTSLELYSEAIRLGEEIIKERKDSRVIELLSAAYLNRGILYRSAGNLEEATEDYNRVIGLLKESKSIRFNIFLASAYTYRGNIYDDKGEIKKAIRDHSKAIKILEELYRESHSLDVLYRLSGAYHNRGKAYFAIGDLDKAIYDYTKAIELLESIIEAGKESYEILHFLALFYTNRGNAYRLKEEFEEALEDYNKAIEIRENLISRGIKDPKILNELAASYMNRGNIYSILGKFDRALEDYNKAIEIRERIPRAVKDSTPKFRNSLAKAYMNRGNIYISLGYIKEAFEDYSRAIEIISKISEEKILAIPEILRSLISAYDSLGLILSVDPSTFGLSIEVEAKIRELLGNLRSNTAYDLDTLLITFNNHSFPQALEKALGIILSLNFSLKRLDIAYKFKDASKKLLVLYEYLDEL